VLELTEMGYVCQVEENGQRTAVIVHTRGPVFEQWKGVVCDRERAGDYLTSSLSTSANARQTCANARSPFVPNRRPDLKQL